MDMPHKHLNGEEGFTGLEAAIVLIAFVVVAAVFAYVVLGAGLFTAQKAQATIHAGVQQGSSSMEVVGNVYGIAVGQTDHLSYANTTVALTAGDTPMDISQMVISYNDNKGGHIGNLTYMGLALDTPDACTDILDASTSSPSWCISESINNQTSGALLDPNAQMVLSIYLPPSTTPYTQFTLNFQPAQGAVLSIQRTVPAAVTPVQILY
jgi:flagellin FlaB